MKESDSARSDGTTTGSGPPIHPSLVSVLMPVYNTERYLATAIESILAQTFRDFEFIIIDDRSTDESLRLLERCAGNDERLLLFRNEVNIGLTRSLNRALELANGKFVARMDADDIALPDRLQRQLEFLESHPDIVAVGCALLLIDEDGWPIGPEPWETQHEAIDSLLLQGLGGLAHPSAMIRRDAILAVGQYNAELDAAQDKDLWLRLAEYGRLANLPDVLLKYRVHRGSITSTKESVQWNAVRKSVLAACVRRGIKPVSLPPLQGNGGVPWARRLTYLIDTAIAAGNTATARKLALRRIAMEPTTIHAWKQLGVAVLGQWWPFKTGH